MIIIICLDAALLVLIIICRTTITFAVSESSEWIISPSWCISDYNYFLTSMGCNKMYYCLFWHQYVFMPNRHPILYINSRHFELIGIILWLFFFLLFLFSYTLILYSYLNLRHIMRFLLSTIPRIFLQYYLKILHTLYRIKSIIQMAVRKCNAAFWNNSVLEHWKLNISSV